MTKPIERRTTMKKNNYLSWFFITMISVLFGYSGAWFYHPERMMAAFNHYLIRKNLKSEPPQYEVPVAATPKPKLEFYTLLTHQVTPISSRNPIILSNSSQNSWVPAPGDESRHSEEVPVLAAIPTEIAPVRIELSKSSNDVKPAAFLIHGKTYMVQLASFRSQKEALRMKAALEHKNFKVTLSMVKQQELSWYRVLIGPFTSKESAQKAQMAFAKQEHIVGMIRQLDA